MKKLQLEVYEILKKASKSSYAVIAKIQTLSGYDMYQGAIYNVPFHLCRSLVINYEISQKEVKITIT